MLFGRHASPGSVPPSHDFPALEGPFEQLPDPRVRQPWDEANPSGAGSLSTWRNPIGFKLISGAMIPDKSHGSGLPPAARARQNVRLLREAVRRAEAVLAWAAWIEKGLSADDAADRVGEARVTLYRWGRALGEADPGGIIDRRWRSGRKLGGGSGRRCDPITAIGC